MEPAAATRALLACLLMTLPPALCAGRDAGAYLPADDGSRSAPALWLALDTTPATDEVATPALLDAVSSWLATPSPSPAGGGRLGLLAMTPGQDGRLAARVLHPPVALDTVIDWPAAERYRHLLLPAPGFTGIMAEALLPALASTGGIVRVWLDLPAPAAGQGYPDHLAVDVLAAGTDISLAHDELAVTVVSTDRVRLDLTVLARSAQSSSATLPATRWRLAPSAGSVPPDWRWPSWPPGMPGEWHLGWREAAGAASGRARLGMALDSLRGPVGSHMPGDAAALWDALARQLDGAALSQPAEVALASGTADCGLSSGLLLTSDDMAAALPPQLTPAERPGWRQGPAWWRVGPGAGAPWPGWTLPWQLRPDELPPALARWHDRALASWPVVDALQPRFSGGRLLGLDAGWLRPVPGRIAWDGDHTFMSCPTPDDCATTGLPAQGSLRAWLTEPAGILPWLTDAGVSAGQPLADWRAALTSVATLDDMLALLGQPQTGPYRDGLRAALQDELRHPPLAQGAGRYLEAEPDASGERRGYLALGLADGGLLLLDAVSGEPVWGWRPARTLAHWLWHRRDVVSEEPALVAAEDWRVWPEPETGRAARYLYGLVAGHLLALDVHRPERPALLFQAALPETARPGSLSLFTQAGEPRLLLSRADESRSAEALWLLDGRVGHVLWRAAPQSAGGVDVVHDGLSAGWRASWQALVAADGGVLLYGVDQAGVVWRLALPAGSGGITLAKVAELADPAGGERFLYPPSLAWLQDAGAGRHPVLAVASRTEGVPAGAHLQVLRDRQQIDGHVLRSADLAPWQDTDARPPAHLWGWVRHWRAPGIMPAGAPRWLLGQVIMTTEVAAVDSCGHREWSGQVHRLPWRAGGAGAWDMAETVDAGVSSLPLSAPVLTTAGELAWAGRPGLRLMLPSGRAKRIRTGKLPVTIRP